MHFWLAQREARLRAGQGWAEQNRAKRSRTYRLLRTVSTHLCCNVCVRFIHLATSSVLPIYSVNLCGPETNRAKFSQPFARSRWGAMQAEAGRRPYGCQPQNSKHIPTGCKHHTICNVPHPRGSLAILIASPLWLSDED
jgi:hypothetical protein